MKTKRLITLLVLILSFSSVSFGQEPTVKEPSNVEVFYFHYTRRCATCNAVESVSKEALKEFYGDKIKMTSVNLDEETGKAKGDKLKVSGQTLLIVSGQTKINITSEGFMYARTKPEKLKEIIKSKINPLL